MKTPKITKTTNRITKYTLSTGVIFERSIFSVHSVKRSFTDADGNVLPRGEAEMMVFNQKGEEIYNRNNK